MSKSSAPTRVALLTPGETLPAWAATAVERMLAETDADVTLVVEDTSTDERSALDAAWRLLELREWGVVAAAKQLLGEDLDPLERRRVDDLAGLGDPERVRCEPETVDGWKNSIPDPVVERMAETDVGVRFGFGFLVGDALTAPAEGVLSFHHGNFREYRGQPMGFWEYVHGRETAGVTLQRLTETLDGGEIVVERRVDVGDAATWDEVRRRLFAASADVLAAGVENLDDEQFQPVRLDDDELGDLYSFPRGRPVLTYLRRTVAGTVLG
ncbi:MAG: formyltransferase family protein [Haloarculaceae archaeon]